MKTYIALQDTVKVLTGKYKGKTGKVTQILRSEHSVVVEGLNKMYKNMRPQKSGDKGQRIEFFAPIGLSKVMLVCPKCGKPTRISIKRDGAKRTRVCKKCKAVME
jgi:large subunit ribosomal protein L24